MSLTTLCAWINTHDCVQAHIEKDYIVVDGCDNDQYIVRNVSEAREVLGY